MNIMINIQIIIINYITITYKENRCQVKLNLIKVDFFQIANN